MSGAVIIALCLYSLCVLCIFMDDRTQHQIVKEQDQSEG